MTGTRRVGWVPEEYDRMSEQELMAGIALAKERLGPRVAILGHHYQRDEIIHFADHRGDSLELSRRAASTDAEDIVFCGVYFMAETAAVLCRPDQTVIQPVEEAICPMAQMASRKQVAAAYDSLSTVWSDRVIPITYQNSTVEIKAFVGEKDGAVCTSSNAQALFQWALDQGGRILFIPDEHLGTNTALDMGLLKEEMGIWNPRRPPDPATLAGCQIVVWKGFCSVHTGFEVKDVTEARERYPEALIVVHPECPREVVLASDAAGSTSYIIQFVDQAPEGATVVVGTECNLVDRLDLEYLIKTVVPLSRRACGSMGLTNTKHLLYVLDGLVRGEKRHVVRIDDETARSARKALEKMLQIS